MIEAKVSNKRSIRIIVGGAEFCVTGTLSEIEAMKELLTELKAYCLYSYTYTLSKEQYAEFFSKSINILYH